MFEYIYIWDRKTGRCVSVWFVRQQGVMEVEEPANTKGAIPEAEMDLRVKALLVKYPEPRYTVDAGDSDIPDGLKAAASLHEQACRDEEE